MSDNSNLQTYFENSGGTGSPSYKLTIQYFEALQKQSNLVKLVQFGTTPCGEKQFAVVIAKNRCFTPKAAKRAGRGVILIQNGIHPGEIEGNDAWMILAREIIVEKMHNQWLDSFVIVLIPVLNIDGHNRASEYNRVNQIGPTVQGWRTNSLNLNMNRDFAKADTPEMRAYLKFANSWKPDIIIDNHTTNGADYQYDISYGLEIHQNIDTALAYFNINVFIPELIHQLEGNGLKVGPYIEAKYESIYDGVAMGPSLPRYSTGYFATRNRIAILVEAHALKPFNMRVESTKQMNSAVLDLFGKHKQSIKKLNAAADRRSVERFVLKKQPIPLNVESSESSEPFDFLGYKKREYHSEITGETVVAYTDEPTVYPIQIFNKSVVKKTIITPYCYVVPQEFVDIIARINAHGILSYKLQEDRECLINYYKYYDVSFDQQPYEGRFFANYKVVELSKVVRLQKGTTIIPTAQPLIRLITQLFEPEAEDSFSHWGFFNAFFERKEYAEDFVFEPIAKKMLSENPELEEEFLQRLQEDKSFAESPGARLDFFYQRSPFYDKRENICPIFKIVDADAIETIKELRAKAE